MQYPARCLQPLNVEPELEGSYNISNGCFAQANVEVHGSGIRHKDYDVEFFGLCAKDLVQVRKLGSGVSGTVYLHRHKELGLMAIKKMNISNKPQRRQMIREIETLYKAECPCLVKFYGAFFEDFNVNIALEFMDRGCLRELINQGPIREDYVAAIALQVLWGCGWLHEARMVHRDLKPENILCDSRGHVKVADFGITKSLENSIGGCKTFTGTGKYMSPERFANKTYRFPSDVWSIGMILHECLSGSHPYDSLKSFDLALKVINGNPPAPPSVASPECGKFLFMCLQKDPKRRPTVKQLTFESEWLQCHNVNDPDSSRYAVATFLETRPPRNRSMFNH